MATNNEILNTIRANASEQYQQIVPVTMKGEYASVADVLSANNTAYNEFLTLLVNKILIQRVYDPVEWAYPFKEFVKDVDPYGDAQELIGFDIGDGEDYTEESKLLEVTKPRITSVSYISTTSKKRYKISFSEEIVKGAITKEYGLTQMLNVYLKRMRVKSDKLWYDKTLSDLATINKTVTVGDPSTDENAKATMSRIIQTTLDMSIPNDDYNNAGYDMALPVGNAILILNTNAKANVDVRVFATLLNSQKINDSNYFKKVYFANFEDSNTIGYILESDSYLIVPRIMQARAFNDGSNLITNYWYHVWTRQGLNKESQMVKLIKA